jgi:ArsR family transcriptional regulator
MMMSEQRTPPAMDANTKSLYEARAKVVKAISHPTRLFLVEELSKGERCVCELTAMVDADVSTVSKHLTILKNAGIVSEEKRGSQVFHTLRVPCILNFFGCVEAVLRKNAESQAVLVAK